MKCMVCENYSLHHICSECQKVHLTPTLFTQELTPDVKVLSFYKYEQIKDFIHTKHTDLGFYIYNILAQNSFKLFAQEFQYNENIVSIAVDDHVRGDYSHTAILNNSLKTPNITPLHNKLRAQSNISYSGKSKQFRLEHPRDFLLKPFPEKSTILVDDIITTGTTLREALSVLQQAEKEVLFSLTLCSV